MDIKSTRIIFMYKTMTHAYDVAVEHSAYFGINIADGRTDDSGSLIKKKLLSVEPRRAVRERGRLFRYNSKSMSSSMRYYAGCLSTIFTAALMCILSTGTSFEIMQRSMDGAERRRSRSKIY